MGQSMLGFIDDLHVHLANAFIHIKFVIKMSMVSSFRDFSIFAFKYIRVGLACLE